MKRVVMSLFVSGLLLLPAYAQSDQAQPGPQQSKSQQSGAKLSQADRAFLREAADGNMAEVEMGKLGQQKGTSSEVKQLSDRLVSDHQQNQQMLQAVAQKDGVKLPTAVSQKHQAVKARLEKLEGTAFDKAFADQAVRAHQKDIAKFKHVQATTKHEELKEYAANTLPKLQEHLKLAQAAGGQGGSTAAHGKGGHGEHAGNQHQQPQPTQ